MELQDALLVRHQPEDFHKQELPVVADKKDKQLVELRAAEVVDSRDELVVVAHLLSFLLLVHKKAQKHVFDGGSYCLVIVVMASLPRLQQKHNEDEQRH